MAVVALNKHWGVTCEWIHEFFSRKVRFGPFGFIPSSAQNPFAFRRLFPLCRDAFREFVGRCGIDQVDLLELCAALNKVHVRVVKSGQHQFAAGIDYLCFRTPP